MVKVTEPETWYFVVDCAKCGKPIPFSEAPALDKQKALKVPTIQVRCPHCHKEGTYAGPLMSRRRAP